MLLTCLSCAEVVDGDLFERRFDDLRRKRPREDSNPGRPFRCTWFTACHTCTRVPVDPLRLAYLHAHSYSQSHAQVLSSTSRRWMGQNGKRPMTLVLGQQNRDSRSQSSVQGAKFCLKSDDVASAAPSLCKAHAGFSGAVPLHAAYESAHRCVWRGFLSWRDWRRACRLPCLADAPWWRAHDTACHPTASCRRGRTAWTHVCAARQGRHGKGRLCCSAPPQSPRRRPPLPL